MTEKIPPRQLILEAVVSCIEKYGIDKVTTRKIAQEAGTNPASINYYFRSKDELVAETLAMTIQHMMEDVFHAIEDHKLSFEQTLRNVFFYLLDGSIRFPGISTAHLYLAVIDHQYDSQSARAMIQVYDRLVARARREFPRADPNEIRMLLSRILSAILFSLLAPDFLPLPPQYRLVKPANTRKQATYYARLFFNQLKSKKISGR